MKHDIVPWIGTISTDVYLTSNNTLHIKFILLKAYKRPIKTKILYHHMGEGHLSIIKILPIRPNIIQTCLIEACANGNLSVVKLLIAKGADIHDTDDWALHVASSDGRLSVVKYLVSKGANIHSQTDRAFRWACLHGHLSVVKFLISKGADVHADGDYALKFSRHMGHDDVAEFLEQYCLSSSKSL